MSSPFTCPECGAGIGLAEQMRNSLTGGRCDACAGMRRRYAQWRAQERWARERNAQNEPPTLPPLPMKGDDDPSGTGWGGPSGAPATP